MTRIGLSGHQNFPEGAVDFVRESIRRVVGSSEDLVGVCSLAVGADQMFATEVLAGGGDLLVVVPSHRYETTFSNEEDRRAYEELLGQAASVETLDYDAPSEEAFFAAGRRVVQCSDVLLAVWDGRPAAGLGGTADVVAYARDLGRTIEIIWPEGIERG